MRGKTPRVNEIRCILARVVGDCVNGEWTNGDKYAYELDALTKKALRQARKRRKIKLLRQYEEDKKDWMVRNNKKEVCSG